MLQILILSRLKADLKCFMVAQSLSLARWEQGLSQLRCKRCLAQAGRRVTNGGAKLVSLLEATQALVLAASCPPPFCNR